MKLYKTKAAKAAKRRARLRAYSAPGTPGRAKQLVTNARWRARNKERCRELRMLSYERHREEIRWRDRLETMLMKIRRAAIAQGLEPFDG